MNLMISDERGSSMEGRGLVRRYIMIFIILYKLLSFLVAPTLLAHVKY